jgi:hypothetical protein
MNQLDIALRTAEFIRDNLEEEYRRNPDGSSSDVIFYCVADMNDLIDILIEQGAVNPDKANV